MKEPSFEKSRRGKKSERGSGEGNVVEAVASCAVDTVAEEGECERMNGIFLCLHIHVNLFLFRLQMAVMVGAWKWYCCCTCSGICLHVYYRRFPGAV